LHVLRLSAVKEGKQVAKSVRELVKNEMRMRMREVFNQRWRALLKAGLSQVVLVEKDPKILRHRKRALYLVQNERLVSNKASTLSRQYSTVL
jgi:hypothetical protein